MGSSGHDRVVTRLYLGEKELALPSLGRPPAILDLGFLNLKQNYHGELGRLWRIPLFNLGKKEFTSHTEICGRPQAKV